MRTHTLQTSLTVPLPALRRGGARDARGINAILRPAHALAFFEMAPPASAADRRVVDAVMAVYGVRDIFIGAATYAAAGYGHRKSLQLGWIVLATSGVAFADGLICKLNGQGDRNWG